MLAIQDLVDDAKCYETVRELRWVTEVSCPHCTSTQIKKRGKHSQQKQRQRYQCQTCNRQLGAFQIIGN